MISVAGVAGPAAWLRVRSTSFGPMVTLWFSPGVGTVPRMFENEPVIFVNEPIALLTSVLIRV